MNKVDLSLHNIPVLLSANKSDAYRDQIIRVSTVLLGFLKEHDLLVEADPFGADGKVKEDFVLRMSNVTSDGLELFKKVVPGWSAYIDKGGEIENISRLEKGLQKIREGKR
ncbi:hypothetical protein C9I57_09955 [Trinickia symbiotica]|uniref:Uncharacterized protein n=2 Tax=Trinickia symbiotica TaxID=863227 RepID=A0A2T3XXG5_9BURK|nr:hypothetical protein C9I57_09955 [Trinickia symbiotica]